MTLRGKCLSAFRCYLGHCVLRYEKTAAIQSARVQIHTSGRFPQHSSSCSLEFTTQRSHSSSLPRISEETQQRNNVNGPVCLDWLNVKALEKSFNLLRFFPWMFIYIKWIIFSLSLKKFKSVWSCFPREEHSSSESLGNHHASTWHEGAISRRYKKPTCPSGVTGEGSNQMPHDGGRKAGGLCKQNMIWRWWQLVRSVDLGAVAPQSHIDDDNNNNRDDDVGGKGFCKFQEIYRQTDPNQYQQIAD